MVLRSVVVDSPLFSTHRNGQTFRRCGNAAADPDVIRSQPRSAPAPARNGFSASAIRGVLKSIAEREDVNVSLQIHSHEEETEMLARGSH